MDHRQHVWSQSEVFTLLVLLPRLSGVNNGVTREKHWILSTRDGQTREIASIWL